MALVPPKPKELESASVMLASSTRLVGTGISPIAGSGFSIFNGTKFKNFSTKNGLANDKVEEIAVDSKNNYWIALDGS